MRSPKGGLFSYKSITNLAGSDARLFLWINNLSFFILTAIQISTFGDLLIDLAEKIGESNTNTEDNRKRKINSAYRFIANKRPWWWLETESTATTTTATDYVLPQYFRIFREDNPIKIGTTWRTLIPQQDLQLHNGSATVVSLPFIKSNKFAYLYGSRIYFVQDTMEAGQTITYYYYRSIAALDENTDEPLLPLDFREAISLFAAGMHLKSQGGPEAVEGDSYLELFDTYMKDMESEDNDRRKYGIKRRSRDPEESFIYRS